MEEKRDEAILVNNRLASDITGNSNPHELGISHRWQRGLGIDPTFITGRISLKGEKR